MATKFVYIVLRHEDHDYEGTRTTIKAVFKSSKAAQKCADVLNYPGRRNLSFEVYKESVFGGIKEWQQSLK